jgi:hypothetical protein
VQIESTSGKTKTEQESSGNKSLGLDPLPAKKSSGVTHRGQAGENRGGARRKSIGPSSPRRKSKHDRELQNQEKPSPVTRTASEKLPVQDCHAGAEMDERALEKSNFLTPGPKTETGRIDAGIMKNLSRADLAHRRQTGTQTGENGERVNVLRGTETRSEATRFLGADWQRKTCINRERSHETSRSELERSSKTKRPAETQHGKRTTVGDLL